MPSSRFAQHDAAVRAALASDLGCSVADFATNALTIVPRPLTPREPFVALVASFGTGTVLSVEEAYRQWASRSVPAEHVRVASAVFLFPFIEEGARRGERLLVRLGGIWLTLADEVPLPALPAGYTLASLDRAAIHAGWQGGAFHNALGERDRSPPGEELVGAEALCDPDGHPVAIAGYTRQGPGLLEIGVDVLRGARGQGFARVVVLAATHAILRLGFTPTYSVGATNIRSLRTALSAGYLPVASLAAVARG